MCNNSIARRLLTRPHCPVPSASRAVPLAPLFSGQPPGATAPEQKSEERTSGACGTEETPAAQASPTILREFRQTLEVCRAGGADPDTAPNTLKLLDSLSAMGSLERVVNMFAVGPREGGSALGPGDEVEAAEKDGNGAALFRTVDWRGCVFCVVVCCFIEHGFDSPAVPYSYFFYRLTISSVTTVVPYE